MAYNIKTVLINNITAIKLAVELIQQNQIANSEQLEILNNFKGWGGIKALLFPLNKNWDELENVTKKDLELEEDIKDFYSYIESLSEAEFNKNSLSSESIWNSLKESILSSFFTPEEVPNLLFKKIKEKNPYVKTFLDPSAGSGVFIDEFFQTYPDAKIIGIEKDFLTSLILRAKNIGFQNITIINDAFENISFEEKFDVIASNIPFGNFKVDYNDYDQRVTNKIHNFFFHHSQNLLNEGGLLAFITSAGVFNSPNNSFLRSKLAESFKIHNLVSFPNNLFLDNGTEVTSHLFIAEKSDVSLLEENQIIIHTSPDENEININPLILKNNGFLKTPKIDTNPYGKLEYNYQLPLGEVLQKLNDFIDIPYLHFIRKTEYSDYIRYDNYPLGFEELDEISFKEELKLLRIPHQYDERNFNVISCIKGIYKGVSIPIATISKFTVEENNKFKSLYLIDSYIQNEELYTPPQYFVKGGIFKQEFEKFTDSLEKFAQFHNLIIKLETKENNPGIEFKKFFFDKFKQPYPSKFYSFGFNHPYYFHREPVPGMLVLNEFENLSYIKNASLDKEGRTLYEVEEFSKGYIDDSTEQILKDYIELYSVYNIYSRVLKGDDTNEIKIYNQKLNTVYDEFVKKHGYINENKKLLTKYEKLYFPVLSTIENKAENISIDLFTTKVGYTKADIFSYQEEIVKPNFTTQDALIKSFNQYGEINIDYIKELTEKEHDEILEELENQIIFNPLNGKYELRDNFLSGNIIQKIKELEKLENQEESIIYAIEELKKVIPEPIPYYSINKQFGNRWIPIDIYEDYINQHFESTFNFRYDRNLDTFFAKVTDKGEKYIRYKCINNRSILPEDVIENAFFDTYPVVTYSVQIDRDTRETKTDIEATNYYKREITKLRQGFENYLLQIDEDKKELLSSIYNENYNNIVLAKSNGNFLNFDDFNLRALHIPEVFEHQKNGIWKMLMNRGGLVDHEVGLGKTFTMIAESYFLKKLKICNKPIIIGLKANITDIAEAYTKLLPNAKVLFATQKDYSSKNREIFFNKIKNNNWDAIIMSHEQFEKIPQDLDIQKEIIEQELEDIENNLYQVSDMRLSKQQLKGLQIRKYNLQIQQNRLIEAIEKRKDKNVFFMSSLGIDHIIVDEYHQFKNLGFQTRHVRVAGIGNIEGSQKARTLLTALRTIQKNTPDNEMGASFYSGTPISNSLTESYIIQKYLTPTTLKRMFMLNFDSWASNFTVKSIEFEVNMVNEIVPKERFRLFVNLPELASMYCSIADVMTADIAKIDRPKKIETLILGEQTPMQKRFYKKLSKFLNTGNPEPLKLEKPLNIENKSLALSIVAMNLAFKASLDMRLINSQLYKDDPDSKINNLTREVVQEYFDFNEHKGTQLIFCDISTSKKNLTFAELEYNYENGIFTSLYDDIKYKLIKGGIKEDEIAFVQNYNTDKKKAELSAKMNEGIIRVLIGGTQNAGTGLNIQKRGTRLHHFTIPWKPSEFDQRNGRYHRQKNWIAKEFNNNEIVSSICATKNTLDSYKIDLNKNKAQFIAQIKNYALGQKIDRTADEGSMDENAGMNLAEFHAQISGDTTLLDKFKIDKQIKELELEKSFVYSQIEQANGKIKEANARINELQKIIDVNQKDYDIYKNNVQYNKKGIRINNPIYLGLDKDNPTDKEIFSFLENKREELKKTLYDKEEEIIARMYGFELVAKNSFMYGLTFSARAIGNTTISYEHNKGRINFKEESNPKMYFMRCFDNIESRLNKNKKQIEKFEEIITENTKKLDYKFLKEEELELLKIKSDELHNKLRANQSYLNRITFKTHKKDGLDIDIIDDIETLEYAIDNDSLGYEGINPEEEDIQVNYIFASTLITELLLDLAKDHDPGIEIHYNYIIDYDKLYLSFVNFQNGKIQEKTDRNILKMN